VIDNSIFNMSYIINLALTGSLGGLAFGFDTGIIGGASLFFDNDFKKITIEDK
jgi:hypothetical protein